VSSIVCRSTRRPRLRHLVAALLVVAAGTVVAPSSLTAPAGAQQGGTGFAVEPSGPQGTGSRDYFVYSLKPGQGLQDTVGVSNFFDQPITYKIYATDAYNTPGDANFALLAEGDAPVDTGTWIKLPVTEYVVQPGQRADIPFTITVPPDATPGDHAGAVVARPVLPEQPATSGQGLNVQRRIGARVYVSVDGPRQPALSIESLAVSHDSSFGSFGRGPATVSYVVRNIGNTRLKPQAFLAVKGPLGITAADTFPRDIPELLPGGTFQVDQTLDSVAPLGHLTVEVTARTVGADAVSVTRTESFWAVPWLGILLVVALVLVVRWRIRRRRRRRAPSAAPAGSSRPAPPREPART